MAAAAGALAPMLSARPTQLLGWRGPIGRATNRVTSLTLHVP